MEHLGVGWFAIVLCSPGRFLTKREQKLMQRRQHAEELLEWKRRLDAEEAEIRRMEKQALAAWDKELLKTKIAKKELGEQRTEPKGDGNWGEVTHMTRVKHNLTQWLLRLAVVFFSDILVVFWTFLESQFLHSVACFTP